MRGISNKSFRLRDVLCALRSLDQFLQRGILGPEQARDCAVARCGHAASRAGKHVVSYCGMHRQHE